jgi:orotidine-5'-phosphate decarboxylase
VTVNPYLGTDSLEPFFATPGKGTIVLCRTSNAGSSEFQSLTTDDEPLYMRVARTAAEKWRSIGECALVVGATYPEELAQVRAIVGDMPILVPGIGAQGGDINAVIRAGTTTPSSAATSQATTMAAATSAATTSPHSPTSRRGLIINSSRAILYASGSANFATAAREAALATRTAINAAS